MKLLSPDEFHLTSLVKQLQTELLCSHGHSDRLRGVYPRPDHGLVHTEQELDVLVS